MREIKSQQIIKLLLHCYVSDDLCINLNNNCRYVICKVYRSVNYIKKYIKNIIYFFIFIDIYKYNIIYMYIP